MSRIFAHGAPVSGAHERRVATRLALLCAANLLLLALMCGSASAASSGYHSRCGVDLAIGQPGERGGATCGTDESDAISFAGEPTGARFFGEGGRDTVTGSQQRDRIAGGPGNDELHGGRGDDVMDGGDDADTLFGGPGDDFIREVRFGIYELFYGGPGNDVIAGGRGNDTLYGGIGDDVLVGGSGRDVLYGGPGNDKLYGGPGEDEFHCGPGIDTVYRVRTVVYKGRSSLKKRDMRPAKKAGCEQFVDRDPTSSFPLRDMVGSTGINVMRGSGSGDLIQGKGSSDQMFGNGGNDELEGDGAKLQGNDLIFGGAGSDRINGRAGYDTLYGDGKSNNSGPRGNDEIVGASGRDLIVGGPGRDLILARYDGDAVRAGAGDDVISLLGGDASEPSLPITVDCGRGRDVVVLNPDRRARFKNCEAFTEQFHELDFGGLFRPSPELLPAGIPRAPDASAIGVTSALAGGPSVTAFESLPPADLAGSAGTPSLSGDGARLAFQSDAANLIASDRNAERTDPFIRDLVRGQTLIADRNGRGRQALKGARLGRSPGGAISANGTRVVFASDDDRLAGSSRHSQILLRDTGTGRVRKPCRRGNGESGNAVISADGRYIAFESLSSNLGGRDRNQQVDVFRCDTRTGGVVRVSDPLRDTVDTSGSAFDPSISADGRYVAFVADGGGIVAGDSQRQAIYRRDMKGGEVVVVDAAPGTLASNGDGEHPRISADGQTVAFDSDATDLPGGETNGRTVDVFVRSFATGALTAVAAGTDGNATADSLSTDGGRIAFTSAAAGIVPADTNGESDVFVRDLVTGATVRASLGPAGAELDAPSAQGALSSDGRTVAFVSRAQNATTEGSPSYRARVYRRDLTTGETVLASPGLDLRPRSLIAEPRGAIRTDKLELIAGTARDNGRVGKVQLTLSRPAGNGDCNFVTQHGKVLKRSCKRPVFLSTQLASGVRFKFKLSQRLRPGNYQLTSRATDSTGRTELFQRGRNLLRVAVKAKPKPKKKKKKQHR